MGVWAFWGSTGVQNLILLATAYGGLYTYRKNQLFKAKTASDNIVLHLKMVDRNIKKIPQDIINEEGIISETSLFYSNTLYYVNEWESNKNIIQKYILNTDFEYLNNYFSLVENLNYYLHELKSMLLGSLQAKSRHYYHSLYCRIDTLIIENKSKEDIKKELDLIVKNQIYKYDNVIVVPYINKEFSNALKNSLDTYLREYKNIEKEKAFTALQNLSNKEICENKLGNYIKSYFTR